MDTLGFMELLFSSILLAQKGGGRSDCAQPFLLD
jgi:hypothetical protein